MKRGRELAQKYCYDCRKNGGIPLDLSKYSDEELEDKIMSKLSGKCPPNYDDRETLIFWLRNRERTN